MSQLARTPDRHRGAPSEQNPDLRRAREGASMWRVAWLQHRVPIRIILGVSTLAVLGLVAYRFGVISAYRGAGCSLSDRDVCLNTQGQPVWDMTPNSTYSYRDMWDFTTTAIVPLSVILGVLTAIPLFPREFSRGTHVFALTQSISRRRWFTTKIVTLATPLTVGMLAVGFTVQWAAQAIADTNRDALHPLTMVTRGPMPAAIALMAFGATVAVSMISKNVIAVLVAALLVSGLIIVVALAAYPFIAPYERVEAPIEQQPGWSWYAEDQNDPDEDGESAQPQVDWDAYEVRDGFLDARHHQLADSRTVESECWDVAYRQATLVVGVGYDETTGALIRTAEDQALMESDEWYRAYDDANYSCLKSSGAFYQFTDTLSGGALWATRSIYLGLLIGAATLLTGLGALLLRRSVSRR